jgi:molecular chaperone DnaJ
VAPQREWFEKDYYKVLGVSEGASQKDITRAYRKLAKENHPDAAHGREERFKEISAAYDVLGDEKRRKEYDEVRRMGPMAAGLGGAPGGPGGGFRFEDLGDLGDIFGGLFGRNRGAGGSTRSRGTGPQRGADLEAELHLSFEDAVHGVTTTINLTSEAACSRCHGTGAEPGTSPVTCPQCGGSGTVSDSHGLFALSQPCPRCRGNGVIVEKPCKNCRGSGHERVTRRYAVKIPAGAKDGTRVRLKGKGEPGRNGGPAGDLFVVVSVDRSPL